MTSYYDIDAILTDAQKVPCTLNLDLPGLGYLDDNAGGDLKKESTITLPFWLCEILATNPIGNSGMVVSLDTPESLSTRVLNALKADARTVELRGLAPHFYGLAIRFLECYEEEEIVDILSATFKKRAEEIADHAHNPRGALGEGAEFLRGLDEMERQLFRAAHDSAKETRKWMNEQKKRG